MTLAAMDRGINIEQSGTNAERLALDVATVKQGTEFYETDTTARYKFYSGAWVVITPSGGAGSMSGSATIADGADVTLGAKADTAATWYNVAGTLVAKLGLLIAATVGAGSHVYGYSNGLLVTDAWTLFGVTRTKTYAYTNGLMTSQTDWV